MAKTPVRAPNARVARPRARTSVDRDRDRAEMRQDTADLTDNVSRLTGACTASMVEAAVGSVQVLADLAADFTHAFARALEGRGDDRRGGRGPTETRRRPMTDAVDSADRAVRDMADVVDRSGRRFSETYREPGPDINPPS